MQLDNKDFYYRFTKNKNGYLVRQKVFKKSNKHIFN